MTLAESHRRYRRLEEGKKRDFFNAHKYSQPRADFHQKADTSYIWKTRADSCLRPYVKSGTQSADFHKTLDGSVHFYGHLP